MKLLKNILLFASMTAASWAMGSIEIQNVDTNAGTLDIYMTNIPACYYCEIINDEIYLVNNNTLPWPSQKEACESEFVGSTWIVDTGMTPAECAAVPSVDDVGGWWFDGNVSGYQFYFIGVTVTEISGGSTETYLDYMNFTLNADCDADGISDEGCTLIIGSSFGNTFIPTGIDELLLSVTFIDYTGDSICFAGVGTEAAGNWSPPIISDTGNPGGTGSPGGSGQHYGAQEVPADWGACYGVVVPGCMDDMACNFNPDATEDDGSCIHAEENYDCGGTCIAGFDECNVCGGIGVIQDCGCGYPGAYGIPAGACDCDGKVEDCAGICGGSEVEDECGICGGIGVIQDCGCGNPGEYGIPAGACDCDGNVEDCADVCGGDLVEDECDVCGGSCFGGPGGYECDTQDCFGNCPDCVSDCFGIEEGTAWLDQCSQCMDCSEFGGDYDECTSSHDAWNASCIDCSGTINGSAYIDACDVCVGGNTGQNACLFDCEGDNIWNWSEPGPFYTDNCGECDSSLDNDCEVDCNGNWGGYAEIDNCGLCVLGLTGQEPCVPDCNGNWGGSDVLDECGECDGIGVIQDCGCGLPGVYGIPNGACDCDGNVSDCAGVCGGIGVLQDCGCGYPGEYGIPAGACDCDGNVADCAGVCGGGAVQQDCGCGIPGELDIPEGYCDCEGNELDECGVCDGDDSTCWDCASVPNGNAFYDNCDECVGGNTEKSPCVPDCNGNWGGSDVLDECGECDGIGVIQACGCGTPSEHGMPEGDCDCNGNTFDECGICGGGGGSNCSSSSSSWTELIAEGGANQITLSWNPIGSGSANRSRGNSSSECTADVCLSIENVDTEAGTLDIYMTNNETVGGFQFELFGITLTGLSGGSSEEYFDFIQFDATNSVLLGASLSGAIIPISSGILIQIAFSNYEGNDICFGNEPDNNVVSGAVGDKLYTDWGICYQVLGCMDELACNYNSNATADDASCWYANEGCDCGLGEGAEVDECGVCNGDNDCIDCNDVINGSAFIDNCDKCVSGDTGLDACEIDCLGIDGGDAEEDECGVCVGPGLTEVCWNDELACCTFGGGCDIECPINLNEPSYKIYRGGLFINWQQPETVFINSGLDYLEQYCYTVTNVNYSIEENNYEESGHSHPACAITNENPGIGGCMSIYACNYDENATVDDGSCLFTEDCNGDCGGTAELDNCGNCDNNSANDCVPDCNGVWDGPAVEDHCGECDADPINDCTQDCSGIWGGSAVEDDCDVCGGDNSSCAGCDGVPNSGLIDDVCGICDGDGFPEGDCDCFGNTLDQCDNCGGENYFIDNSGEFCDPGSSADCLYQDMVGTEYCDCDDNVLDECGVCGGEGAVFGDSNCCEADLDSCDRCPQNSLYGAWLECGEGALQGCFPLPELPNEKKAAGYLGYCNCPESCESTTSDKCEYPEWGNVIPILADCAGVCGGSAVEDDCEVCGGDNTACIDCSGYCENQLCIGGSNDGGDCSDNGDINCPGIFNGPTQYDCGGVCGGSAVYDCRYGNIDFIQGNCSGEEGCGELGTAADCTGASDDLECIWTEVEDYCNGSFLDTGAIYECYGYSNIGEWVLKTEDDEFATATECIDYVDENGNEDYFWINTGKDECGVCDGPGPIYTKDENGDVIEGGECCEADLDGCGVCGAEIGEQGPGLSNLGECAGDAGCEVYIHNKVECESDIDALNCYWGAWCDCSGTAVTDCRNNCPEDATGEKPYIGDQGTFGRDECGVCDGDGAVYGNFATGCEAYVDECGGCHQGLCTGEEDCIFIENEVECLIGGEGELTCEWTDSEYADPETQDPLWNFSGCASPEGIEDDCSIYCDCGGNIADCRAEFGKCTESESESLVGRGDFECIGGDYDNQTDCEINGKCSGDVGCDIISSRDECIEENGEGDELICYWNFFVWTQTGNDCSGECDGTDFSCLVCDDTAGDCTVDSYENSCYSEQIDVCGLCFGRGVSEGFCDCFDNIGNCAGDCPTQYYAQELIPCIDISGNNCTFELDGEIMITTLAGNSGEWQFNEDYDEISGSDNDGADQGGDGICDNEDLCISSGETYLIFMIDGSITDTYFPSVCLDVCTDSQDGKGTAVEQLCDVREGIWHEENYSLSEIECNDLFGDWIPSTPNPAYGGYDICGVCNGDGFSCGFEAEGALNAVNLTWNKPNLGSIEDIADSLGITSMNFDDDADNPILFTAGTGGLNEMNSTGSNVSLSRSASMSMSSSLYSSILEDELAEICSEYTVEDTTISEYGFFTDLTPAASLEIINVDIVAGTLDLSMTNIPACSYCDPIHENVYLVNNPTFPYPPQKASCESTFVGSNWIVDTGMTQAECAAVPSYEDKGGWWFDGNVSAFQFYLRGVTVTEISGGSTETYLDFMNFTSNADCDADGIGDEGCTVIIGSSFGNSFIPAGIDELLLSVTFTDFNGLGVCFDGVGREGEGVWSNPIVTDTGNPGGTGTPDGSGQHYANQEVLADWGTCYCSDNYPADECGVCGGEGVLVLPEDGGCGCGLPGNCVIQEGACDCTGRLPNDKYTTATAFTAGDDAVDGEYICWDEAEVCDFSECTPDPNAVSYNVYRQDIIGNYIQIASNLSNAHYTDANLGYEEGYTYAISYYRDANQNEQFEFIDEEYTDINNNDVWDFVDYNLDGYCDVYEFECEPFIDTNGDLVWTPMEEFHKPINPVDFEIGDEEPVVATATTPALLPGCTYPTACGFNASANYGDGSCWWPSYLCDCDEEAGALADNCGECDADPINDCETDCFGAWGGSAVEDECGVCDNDPTNDGNSCPCDGEAYRDNCGDCVGGGTNLTACVADCNGIWGGTAAEDACGICAGGTTDFDISWFNDVDTLIFTGAYDCNGTCFGDAAIDVCGICAGGVTEIDISTFVDGEFTGAYDCNGTCFGDVVVDDCGECGGDGTSCLSLYFGLIPDEFSIHNIYPNPFNPYANIIYAVPENTRVKVTIYDLNGRQIAVLKNEFQTPGYHSIQWDASQYSSGVYFVEMLSGDFRQIRQVLHMK